MTNLDSLVERLRTLADIYERPSFVDTDPVQFPRRYCEKQDIEISGFITSWLSYGSRKVFIPLLDTLHAEMGESPYQFIIRGGFRRNSHLSGTLYRFCRWEDYHEVCSLLERIYLQYPSMEDWIIREGIAPVESIGKCFGHVPQIPVHNGTSSCKKLHMFMRWMVRRNSPVDIGIWNRLDRKDLQVPVDVHVLSEARRLGITARKQADRKTVEEITAFARLVFPEDPARLDFALYGHATGQLWRTK